MSGPAHVAQAVAALHPAVEKRRGIPFWSCLFELGGYLPTHDWQELFMPAGLSGQSMCSRRKCDDGEAGFLNKVHRAPFFDFRFYKAEGCRKSRIEFEDPCTQINLGTQGGARTMAHTLYEQNMGDRTASE